MTRLLAKIKAFFALPPPYRHPLARERQEVADAVVGMSDHDRQTYICNLPSEVYETWILDPYPGAGDTP